MNSLFLQGLVYSTLSLGIVAGLTWWLFFSPMRRPSGAAMATRPHLSGMLALLIGLGTLLICIGGYWDASEHVITGIIPGGEDFLWPPHLMIYGGFLITFLVAVGGLLALAVPNLRIGVQDPRQWTRRNPYISAVVLAAGYGLFSIPGDAIWHELYGIDLTAWSPPHIFLVMASASLAIFAVGLLLNSRAPAQAAAGRTAAPPKGSGLIWRNFLILFYLALALNELLIIGSIEWEINDVVNGYIAQRPTWLYPTIIGATALFILTLARRVVHSSWTATITALLYFGFRMAVSAFTDVISGAPPRLTLVFILGAFLLDLTAQRLDWAARQPLGSTASLRPSWVSPRLIRSLAAAGMFTIGYALVALPMIQFYLLPFLPSFTIVDHLATILLTFLLAAALHPLAMGLGGWLQAYIWEETPAEQELPNALGAPAGN